MARRAAASFGLAFTEVDVDREPEAIRRFALRTLPELILSDGTSILGRLSGLVSEYELRRTVQELLASITDRPPRNSARS